MNILKQLFGGGTLPQMDIETYLADYEKESHVLIDVRTSGEYKAGHLPKAKNIPLDELSNRLDSIPKDKPVILVCWSGSRSASGSQMLVQAGYTNVHNLKGGTMRWQMLGKTLQ